MKQTARGTALDALLNMHDNEGYSNLVIDRTLEAASLSRLDASLCSNIFYGVLEKRITLDYYLSRFVKSPLAKLDKTVLEVLRCGAYQIMFLDRVPDSAAVNEAVNEAKKRGKGGLSGLVNAVLRNISRQKGSLTLPQGNSVSALSVRYSVPERLVSLWKGAYGEDFTISFLDSLSAVPELFIRLNPIKAGEINFSSPGASIKRLPFPQNAAVLSAPGSPADLDEYKNGLFHVQDYSAQLVCELVDARPGEIICDCCAAPGGKSFTMAGQMNDSGRVYSFDLYPNRVKLIEAGAKRLGLRSISALALDMTKPIPFDLPAFDKVLCDAPCSGFGVIRRKPEIRYKDPDELKTLPALQREILNNAAKLVKPGGKLIYSTCTLNPAENGNAADEFLRENPGFSPLDTDLAEKGIVRCIDEPANQLTMTPFSGASDGFFAAAFIRRD